MSSVSRYRRSDDYSYPWTVERVEGARFKRSVGKIFRTQKPHERDGQRIGKRQMARRRVDRGAAWTNEPAYRASDILQRACLICNPARALFDPVVGGDLANERGIFSRGRGEVPGQCRVGALRSRLGRAAARPCGVGSLGSPGGLLLPDGPSPRTPIRGQRDPGPHRSHFLRRGREPTSGTSMAPSSPRPLAPSPPRPLLGYAS